MAKPTITKEIGREYVHAEEDAIIEEMMQQLVDQVDRLYEDKKMLRQIHTKMHGCVKADFTIEPNLPEEFRVGVFKESRNYHCWVRFSNSQTHPQNDKKKDIRGIAIKLMGVPGEKILNHHKDEATQDFLLMSSETFFSRNVKDFKGALRAFTSEAKTDILKYFLNPMHWGTLKRLIKTMIKCENVLGIPYWSTQPFQFGSIDRAVKYYLEPSEENKIVNQDTKGENYLRKNMAQTLNNNDIVFDFFVQFQTDAENMPIEDPTVPWGSENIKLATLTIFSQEFDSNAQMEFGDNLSFNAWHSLPAHRPLGSFNRARRRIYKAMSQYRHEKNGLPVFEPKDDPNFHIHNRLPALERHERKIPKKRILKKSASVLVDCDKETAFNFIASGDQLPNWLKKVGLIPPALYVEVIEGPYNKVGAKRIIHFEGGDSAVEELMTYNPFANYSYSITKFSNFLKFMTKEAFGQLWFNTVDDKTEITWDYSFTYRHILAHGFLAFFLSSVYVKFMQICLDNAKEYIEKGD